jgi:hypothetical protein
MEMYDDASSEAGPVSSFQSLAAEGDIHAKQGEFRKAAESYTKVTKTASMFILLTPITRLW